MVTFAAKTECTELFAKRFEALTGNAPFPWQECLFLWLLSDKIPPADVSLPTGTGKTSIMAIWLLALAEKSAEDSRQNPIPRRLTWVVNRRVVVDQATNEAEQIRRRVNDPAIVELEPIRSALRKLSGETSGEILGISTLRGQFEDNAEWRGDPSRPAVIVGTVDMIGSRLLFSGYGIGFKARPLHAGFLGQDVLLVHDEAHLEPAFQELLIAIREEQKRCGEFGKFHVMALSATSRAKNGAFGLTQVEKDVPNEMPDPSETPLHVIWRRQGSKKTISLHENKEEGKLANEIADLALEKKFKDSGRAVLVFVRRIEDVKGIAKKLKSANQRVQPFTGTMRGFERDKLVKEDAIFRRFLPGAEADGATVYLVCTSAGEVGVNISADHLICDLSPFDSMVQRFGRVNRFGDRNDTEIHVFYPAEFKKDNELDDRRQRTLVLLNKLPDGQASPNALGELNVEDCQAAFTPTPRILSTTDILFDSWALTTIRGKFPGRPAVEPYLHGVSEYEPPETHVAWREEVGVVSGKLLEQYDPENLLDTYPLKPLELLRDRSDRVLKDLKELAKRFPVAPVWLLTDDGAIEVFTLEDLANDHKKDRINDCTVLLPPSVGGLSEGSLDGISGIADEVADGWRDVNGTQRRIRVWDDDPQLSEKITGMRLIRTIDTDSGSSDGLDADEAASHRYWHWYELPKVADNDGSERDAGAVLWQVHTDDVVKEASRIVEQSPLSDEMRKAVVVAARFHDSGKRRLLFQRIIGNVNTNTLLAKSGRKKQPYTLNKHFRHEFASLLDVQKESDFLEMSEDMKEVVLHLVAAHHGRGRPYFPAEEAYDPEATDEMNSIVAAQVPQRFARLQRKFGRWGLAYLESLLRAADYAASANPSAFWDGEQ
jgi:CRISPR-associated endonuclease/helicase Cas3